MPAIDTHPETQDARERKPINARSANNNADRQYEANGPRLKTTMHQSDWTVPRHSAGPQSQQPTTAAETPPGSTLGRELPAATYLSILGSYVWLLAVGLIAFNKGLEVDYIHAFASIVVLIMLGIPAIAFRQARLHARSGRQNGPEPRITYVETATGRLPVGEAWLQILLISGSLAFAATLIGIVYRIVT